MFSFRELHYSVNRSAHKGSNGYDKLIENNESVHKFLEWFSLACHMSPEKLVFWVLEWVCAKKKILLLPCGPGHGMDRALLGRVQQTEEEMRVLLAVASRSGGHLIAGEWKCLPGSAVHHPIPSRKKHVQCQNHKVQELHFHTLKGKTS